MASLVKGLIEYVGINTNFPDRPNIFKEFMVQEHIQLDDCYPDIEQITRVSVCVEITNSYEIKTPVPAAGVSNPSGQILTGRKLIIEGVIHQSISFVADNCDQGVHVIDNDTCFSTFAVLPVTPVKTSYIVIPYIEDISIDQIGPRDMLKCVTIFLEVQ